MKLDCSHLSNQIILLNIKMLSMTIIHVRSALLWILQKKAILQVKSMHVKQRKL